MNIFFQFFHNNTPQKVFPQDICIKQLFWSMEQYIRPQFAGGKASRVKNTETLKSLFRKRLTEAITRIHFISDRNTSRLQYFDQELITADRGITSVDLMMSHIKGVDLLERDTCGAGMPPTCGPTATRPGSWGQTCRNLRSLTFRRSMTQQLNEEEDTQFTLKLQYQHCPCDQFHAQMKVLLRLRSDFLNLFNPAELLGYVPFQDCLLLEWYIKGKITRRRPGRRCLVAARHR